MLWHLSRFYSSLNIINKVESLSWISILAMLFNLIQFLKFCIFKFIFSRLIKWGISNLGFLIKNKYLFLSYRDHLKCDPQAPRPFGQTTSLHCRPSTMKPGTCWSSPVRIKHIPNYALLSFVANKREHIPFFDTKWLVLQTQQNNYFFHL